MSSAIDGIIPLMEIRKGIILLSDKPNQRTEVRKLFVKRIPLVIDHIRKQRILYEGIKPFGFPSADNSINC